MKLTLATDSGASAFTIPNAYSGFSFDIYRSISVDEYPIRRCKEFVMPERVRTDAGEPLITGFGADAAKSPEPRPKTPEGRWMARVRK